jgi:hypothetical protein
VPAAPELLVAKQAFRAAKIRNSLQNSLLAGNSHRDGCDQHCVASQAVRRSEKVPLILAERPANGGLYELATGLREPILVILKAKQPIISGGHLKNSHFGRLRPETGFDLHYVAGIAVLPAKKLSVPSSGYASSTP